MKKFLATLLSLVLVLSLASACADDLKVIRIGATAEPHAEILESEIVTAKMAELGFKLDVIVYDGYSLQNPAVSDGTDDGNYFQHHQYLASYNASVGEADKLATAFSVHYEPFGIYSEKIKSLDELKDGAIIALPNDPSNETRAMLLLAAEGLITLPEGANAIDGVNHLDIVDNGGYEVVAVQADTVPSQLENSNEGSVAVINGNYALQAGLNAADALAVEDASGDAAQTYANIIACRKGEESSEKIAALVAALQTEAVKTYIAESYNGAVVAIF